MNKVEEIVENEERRDNNRKVGIRSARGITTIAILGATAGVLMLFEIPLWFAPPFYQIDLSEVPVMIGAFALGPLAGVLIELVKILLKLMFSPTKTAFVGEFANFILGCAFVVPAALIYKVKKTKKSAYVGLGVGTLFLAAAGSFINAYLLLPFYSKAMIPMDKIIAMGTEVNGLIKNMKGMIIYAVIPFNLIKGVLVSLIVSLLYKKISFLIKDFHPSK